MEKQINLNELNLTAKGEILELVNFHKAYPVIEFTNSNEAYLSFYDTDTKKSISNGFKLSNNLTNDIKNNLNHANLARGVIEFISSNSTSTSFNHNTSTNKILDQEDTVKRLTNYYLNTVSKTGYNVEFHPNSKNYLSMIGFHDGASLIYGDHFESNNKGQLVNKGVITSSANSPIELATQMEQLIKSSSKDVNSIKTAAESVAYIESGGNPSKMVNFSKLVEEYIKNPALANNPPVYTDIQPINTNPINDKNSLNQIKPSNPTNPNNSTNLSQSNSSQKFNSYSEFQLHQDLEKFRNNLKKQDLAYKQKLENSKINLQNFNALVRKEATRNLELSINHTKDNLLKIQQTNKLNSLKTLLNDNKAAVSIKGLSTVTAISDLSMAKHEIDNKDYKSAAISITSATANGANALFTPMTNTISSPIAKTTESSFASIASKSIATKAIGPVATASSFANCVKYQIKANDPKLSIAESDKYKNASYISAIGSLASIGTASMVGATIGSAYPVVGTLVGLAVGASIGIMSEYKANQQISAINQTDNINPSNISFNDIKINKTSLQTKLASRRNSTVNFDEEITNTPKL